MLCYLLYILILHLFTSVTCQNTGNCAFVDQSGNEIDDTTIFFPEKRPTGDIADTLYVKHDGVNPSDVKVDFGFGDVKLYFNIEKSKPGTNMSEFVLKLKKTLDLSTKEGQDHNSLIDFDVKCTPGGKSTLVIKFFIYDINENPIFNVQSPVYHLTENFPIDLEFTKLFYPNIFAWDLDHKSPSNRTHYSELEFFVLDDSGKTESQIFGIKTEQLSGFVSNYSVNLYLKQQLHYRTTPLHNFIILAKDVSSDPLNVTIPITLHVEPNLVSTLTPKFDLQIYTSQIIMRQKSLIKQTPFELSMEPNDILATISDNSTIIYEIDSKFSDYPRCFQLSGTTVELVNPNDLITNNLLSTVLTIKAFVAGASPDLYDTTRVDIEIVHQPVFNQVNQKVLISRETKVGSLIWVANAGPFAKYSIQSTGTIPYVLDEETGELTVVDSIMDTENVTLSILASVVTRNGIKLNGDECELYIGIFEIQSDFECSVNENEENINCSGVSLGSHVGYEIISGNDDGYFEFLGTGELKIIKSLDYETNSDYHLTVKRSPPGVMYNIRVNVLDVNEPPKITNINSVIGISPWTQFGQILTTFKADDPDFGLNGEVSYAIKTNLDGFYVESTTGEFYHFTKPTHKIVSLTISATDKGIPAESHEMTLQICKLDVDEIFQLIIQAQPKAITDHSLIANNLTNLFNFDVGMLSWEDELNPTRTRFSLFGVKNNKIFKYNEIEGLAKNLHSKLTDLFGNYQIEPYIENNGDYICSVLENEKNVTCDGLNLKPHSGYNIIHGNNDGNFEILATGQLQIIKPLNFEDKSFYQLTIQKSPGDEFYNVSVVVIDVNEPPVILNKIKIIGIAPWTPFGQVLTTVRAVDHDIGLNGDIYYEINTNLDDFFIDSSTGEFYHLRKTMDKMALVNISAIDKGNPPLKDEQVFEVYFLESDDVFELITPPGVNSTFVTNSLIDLLTKKIDIGLLSWDSDDHQNQKTAHSLFAVENGIVLKYETIETLIEASKTELTSYFGEFDVRPYNEKNIIFSCSVFENENDVICKGLKLIPHTKYQIVNGDEDGVFEMMKDGYLKIKSPLNYEEKSMYELQIQRSTFNLINVTVTVIDVNESPNITHVTSPIYVAPWIQSGKINSDFKAEDPDVGLNGDIYWQIDGENDDFVISPSSGELHLLKKPQNKEFGINISVVDKGTPNLSDQKTVYIYFLDADEIFQLLVKSVDTDEPVKLVENLTNLLNINVGILRLEDELTRTRIIKYSLFAVKNETVVKYPQMEILLNNSSTELKELFGVVNIQPYTEKVEDYECSVKENEINVFCNGLQLVQNSGYNIISGDDDGNFEILETGQLKIKSPLNYEEKSTFILKIQRPPSTIINIKVNVIDVNEPPVITKIDELIGFAPWNQLGQILTTVKAEDPDGGLNGEIYYELTTSADESIQYFHTNSKTGEFYVLQKPTEKVILLNVSAIDRGSPVQSDKKMFKVYFLDKDEIFRFSLSSDGNEESIEKAKKIVIDLSKLLELDIGLLYWETDITKTSSLNCSLFAAKDDKPLKYQKIEELMKSNEKELTNKFGTGTHKFQPHTDLESPIEEVKPPKKDGDDDDDDDDDDDGVDKSMITIIALSVALAVLVVIVSLKFLCAKLKRGDQTSDTSQLLRQDLGALESNRESECHSQVSTEDKSKIEIDDNKTETENTYKNQNEANGHVNPLIEEITTTEIIPVKSTNVNEELDAEKILSNPNQENQNRLTKPDLPKEDYDLNENTNTEDDEKPDEKSETKTTRLIKPEMPPKDYEVSDDEDEVPDKNGQNKMTVVKFNEQPEIIENDSVLETKNETDEEISHPRKQSVKFDDNPEIIDESIDDNPEIIDESIDL